MPNPSGNPVLGSIIGEVLDTMVAYIAGCGGIVPIAYAPANPRRVTGLPDLRLSHRPAAADGGDRE